MDLISSTENIISLFSFGRNPFDEGKVEAIEKLGNEWQAKVKDVGINEELAAEIIHKAQEFGPYALLYIYSLLLKAGVKFLDITALYDSILLMPLSASEKFFVYYQLKSINFQGINSTSSKKIISLYKQILNAFNTELKSKISYVPASERNPNLVIVFTAQFLGLNHAPTKTALDRIKILHQYHNKEVILINTCELLPRAGAIPWFDMSIANRVEIDQQALEYQGSAFKYAQCSQLMPNVNEMAMLIDVINTLKPSFTISIGESLLADITSQIIPNAVVSTVFSSLSYSPSQFRIIGRNMTQHDVNTLQSIGLSPDSVIESTFTFDFKPQRTTLSRAELNLPEKAFIVALVGARLTTELSENFLQELLPLFAKNIHFVIIGKLENYQYFNEKYSGFEEHFSNIGFQDDVLAVLESCDLYLNPPRIGGGSSAAEALYKGVPVVTLAKGDVATAVGEKFIVNDFEDMRNTIIQYKNDNAFYRQQSLYGKERADILLNSEKAFSEVLQQIYLHHFFDTPWIHYHQS